MKSFIITVAAFLTGAANTNAAVTGDRGRASQLTTFSGASEKSSQLDDGQSLLKLIDPQPATFIIGQNGGIFDQNGRECILTPQTTQLRYDLSVTPTTGFPGECDGIIALNSKPRSIACQTSNQGSTISTTASCDSACVDKSADTDSCHSADSSLPVSPLSPAATSSKTTSSPAPTLPSSPPSTPTPTTCPADLSGTFEYPHLIVPVSSTNPNRAHGISYNGKVSRADVRTIFNFDIKPTDAGKSCSLVFLFPRQDLLIMSSFMISGDGNVSFASLNGGADSSTTNNNAPAVVNDYGVFNMAPGNSYTIATFDCPAGRRLGFAMSATNTDFIYFQNYRSPP